MKTPIFPLHLKLKQGLRWVKHVRMPADVGSAVVLLAIYNIC